MGNNLSSQSERSFRIPKQSIVIEPEQKEEQKSSVNQIPAPEVGSSIRRLDLTNHHVDVLWFQATKKFSSQTDPFKVHKNSPKNFKPILRNHLNKNPQNYSLILKEPPRVRYAVCLTRSSVWSFGFWTATWYHLPNFPMPVVSLTSLQQHCGPALVSKERIQC